MSRFVRDRGAKKPCLVTGTSRTSRLVWEKHFGPIPKKLSVLHDCDNKLCREPSHLFLGTQSDNIQDAVRKGRWPQARHRKNRPKGESHPNARVTAKDVIASRRAYVPRKVSLESLGKRFGISFATVYEIVSKRTWAHV